MAKKSSLGKGLGALIQEYSLNEVETNGAIELKIIDVEPNQNQPRKQFDKEKLEALTQSIKQHGIIQPILVVKNEDRYQIIAGERRWRAAKNAGLKVIPAIIKEYDDNTIIEIALIENLQREDLNPIEEALGYKYLMNKFNMTQDKISERVGKSRSAVANSLRILSLPKEVTHMLENGEINSGHAKVLVGIQSTKQQISLANEIVKKGLSVRAVEALIKNVVPKPLKRLNQIDTEIQTHIKALEEDVSRTVGTKVHIKNNKGKGKIEIEYYSNEDLERILNILKY